MAASPEKGSVSIVLGPMFSGKTSEMVREISRARLGGFACVIVKHAKDRRYSAGPELCTHDGVTLSSEPRSAEKGSLRVAEVEKLADVKLEPDELVVGVDEGQFYGDLPEVVDRWAREGHRVHIAALDGDFRRRPFGRVLEAIPLARSVVKLSAVCMLCPRGDRHLPADAAFTVRIADSPEIELVGAKETYRAACADCYARYTENEREA